MINKELAENVASAIKSCELEGFIYTKEEQKIFAQPFLLVSKRIS